MKSPTTALRRPGLRRGAAFLSSLFLTIGWSSLPAGWGPSLRAAALPANCNGDAQLDISDAVFLLDYLFQNGDSPSCPALCDFQQDGQLDLSDAISILMYVIQGKPTPR